MKKWHTGAVLAIAILVTFGASTNNISATQSKPDEGFKNLKVLPENITDKQLDSVMHNFSISLGVHCNFCHARKADTAQRGLDFASDKKDEKNRAREMYKMTRYLNTTFFNPDHSTRPDTIHEIVCYTCHRGNHVVDADVFLGKIDSIEKSFHKNH
jgi:Photosynthetic reaction centre cytochrome C subunit